MKTDAELLKEALTKKGNPITMAYFDEEDKLLQKRIDESAESAKSMEMSYEKMHQKYTL